MAYQPKSYRKFLATSTAAALVATAVAPAASAAFTDVSGQYTDAVNFIVEKGIANGLTDTTFGVSKNIKRGDAAVMIAKALGLDTANAPDKGFTDVNSRIEGAVNALAAKQIINGKTETTFSPDANMTRGEMALVIAKAFDLKGDNTGLNFTDVNSRYAEAVKALVANDITQGKTATTFGTDQQITRGEFAVFMYKAMNLNVAPEVVSVSAITSKTAKVTFKGAMAELSTEDFNVNGGLSVVDVELSADKKSATVTFSKDMVDGAEYTLQLLDKNGDAVSEKAFKYVLGEVDSIALTKNVFEVGENAKNFLKVYDNNGVEISTADYNVIGIESSNTAVVATTGAVAGLGTANLRFEIEYKDGSRTKSDFIRVDVEQAVTASLAGFYLDDDATADYDNTVDYRENGASAKVSFYKSDAAHFLQVFADDSKTNPEVEELDLSTSGDYTVVSKTPTVVTATQGATGTELTPISTGKATIEITGPNSYKKTLTVDVKADPEFKDLLVSATSVKLSDEAVGGTDLGVNQEEVTLQWVDQHGTKRSLDAGSSATNTSAQEQVLTDVIVPGDKVVISSTATAFDIEDVTAGASKFALTAKQGKTVSNASVRVSYYADATASKATLQKTVSTSVVDVDSTKPAANYETLVTNSAVDAYIPAKRTTTVDAFAVDSKGNRIDDVTSDITLSFADSVSVSEQEWFTLATNTSTFATDAWKYMTETGAIKLEYTVAGASDPHGAVTVNYTNSFAAPAKAVVSTSPVLVDTADTNFASGVSVEELLFGKIAASSPELVIDDAPADTSIAIKKGFDGYANKPVLSFLDKNGKAVVTGAGLYGLTVAADTTGNGFLVDAGSYDANAVFEVEYTITNAKDLAQTAAGTLANVLTIDGTADQASFTVVVTKVTVANDPRVNNAGTSTPKNLLEAPKSFNVIIK